MKKFIVLMLALAMLLCGCGDKNANAKWDAVEYTSLEDMNTAAGTNIQTIEAEKTDENYVVISESIAQYKFNTNGETWCVRGSKNVDEDISGLNYENIGFEKDTTSVYYNDEVYAMRFFHDNLQYVISLDVKDKDIATSYFDKVCAELQTNITGVKSGYENELFEDGNDVVYRITMFNADGSKTVMDTIYVFENDKMVSIKNSVTFDTEAAAKEYYDLLIENGRSADELLLEGTCIRSNADGNLEFYQGYTKAAFMEMMQNSMAQ